MQVHVQVSAQITITVQNFSHSIEVTGVFIRP